MTDFSKDTLKDLWAKLTEDERHFFLGDGRPPTWRESEALAANGLLEGSGGVMGRYSLTDLGRALAEYGRALRDEPSTAEEWRNNAAGYIEVRLRELRKELEGPHELCAPGSVIAQRIDAQNTVNRALVAELEQVMRFLELDP